jgi:pentatricopeptide repeat protein
MNKMRLEVEGKISVYAAKLEQLIGPNDQRVKKRVLQALGKLKKQLAEVSSSNDILVDKDGCEHKAPVSSEVDAQRENLSGESVPVLAILSRKQLKAKLKLLNRELAECAQKKQLKIAIKRFSWGVRKGMEPDKHTYANLMNCYVRCGDLEGALKQFKSMQDAKISSNIIIYTTLLKGYCDKGDISGAKNILFSEIPINLLVPGVRTVNTFVRGCTKTGAVGSALQAFHLLQCPSSQSQIIPGIKLNLDAKDKKRKRNGGHKNDPEDDDSNDDALDDSVDRIEDKDGNDNDGKDSLYESIVALLCQALRIEEAANVAVGTLTAMEAVRG